MTTVLYEIATSEAEDGTTAPAEGIWTPGEDATDNGFVVYRGLYVASIGAPNDDGPHSDRFIVLGHQRWGGHHRGRPPRTWTTSTTGEPCTSTRATTPRYSSLASRAQSTPTASSYDTRTLV